MRKVQCVCVFYTFELASIEHRRIRGNGAIMLPILKITILFEKEEEGEINGEGIKRRLDRIWREYIQTSGETKNRRRDRSGWTGGEGAGKEEMDRDLKYIWLFLREMNIFLIFLDSRRWPFSCF